MTKNPSLPRRSVDFPSSIEATPPFFRRLPYHCAPDLGNDTQEGSVGNATTCGSSRRAVPEGLESSLPVKERDGQTGPASLTDLLSGSLVLSSAMPSIGAEAGPHRPMISGGAAYRPIYLEGFASWFFLDRRGDGRGAPGGRAAGRRPVGRKFGAPVSLKRSPSAFLLPRSARRATVDPIGPPKKAHAGAPPRENGMITSQRPDRRHVLIGGAAALALAPSALRAQTARPLKIGVLNDMSSVYADYQGVGSVIAAQLAVDDFSKAARRAGRDHFRRPSEQARRRLRRSRASGSIPTMSTSSWTCRIRPWRWP